MSFYLPRKIFAGEADIFYQLQKWACPQPRVVFFEGDRETGVMGPGRREATRKIRRRAEREAKKARRVAAQRARNGTGGEAAGGPAPGRPGRPARQLHRRREGSPVPPEVTDLRNSSCETFEHRTLALCGGFPSRPVKPQRFTHCEVTCVPHAPVQ